MKSKIYICENCGKQHNGQYGSGRFCSKKCARSYSTKNDNSKETKEIICTRCGRIEIINKRSNQILCNECKSIEKQLLQNKKEPTGILVFCKYSNFECNKECYFYKNNICNGTLNSITHKLRTMEKHFKLPNTIISNYNKLIKYVNNLKNELQK